MTLNKASILSVQLALNPTEFIYGELVFYAGAQDFGFRSAENLKCDSPPAEFKLATPDMQVVAKDDGTTTTFTYAVSPASQCGGVTLVGSWSVDRVDLATTPIVAIPPPALPATPPPLTGAGYTLTIYSKKDYIGQYAVRMRYEST